MTRRESFRRDEWLLLGDAPLAAGAAVAIAEAGGGRREAAAIVSGWREAGRMFANSELIVEIVAGLDPEDREQQEREQDTEQGEPPAFDAIIDEALELCERAIDLLAARATPAETEDYRGFVMHIAKRVAMAENEGILGGEPVSRAERGVMRELAMALGFRRPLPPLGVADE